MVMGGRASVRTALYMPTLTAIRRNPTLQAFYQRLIGRGRPAKVAITACMRKLLVILNAILRDPPTMATRLTSNLVEGLPERPHVLATATSGGGRRCLSESDF